MTGERVPALPRFDPETFHAVIAIVERIDRGLREACLLQDDKDERARHIEWYRGGAQVLAGLRGEIEQERLRREQEPDETPEEAVARSMEVLARNGVVWDPLQPLDRDAEL